MDFNWGFPYCTMKFLLRKTLTDSQVQSSQVYWSFGAWKTAVVYVRVRKDCRGVRQHFKGSSTNGKIVRPSGAGWEMKCFVNDLRVKRRSQTNNLHQYCLKGFAPLSGEHKQNLYLYGESSTLKQWDVASFSNNYCASDTLSQHHTGYFAEFLKISTNTGNSLQHDISKQNYNKERAVLQRPLF